MEIINKQGYFYLKHSYKEEGKVKTKDIYLGKTIPKDIEKIKNQFLRQINRQTIFKKFDLIKKNYQINWEKIPLSVKKTIIEEKAVDFTYNTNAIEGSTITLEETKQLICDGITPGKSLRDIHESINHAKKFTQIMEDKLKEKENKTDKKKPNLSINLIKQWHLEVFKESKPDIAGKFREYHVRVGNYICPDWQDVDKLMKEFIRWYNRMRDKIEQTKIHPVELAAKAHYRFVKIHPFGDGNGRITRLIMNLILHKYGYPILVIEYKKRKSYYHALEQADKKTEWEFLKYIYRRYLKYNKEYLKKHQI